MGRLVDRIMGALLPGHCLHCQKPPLEHGLCADCQRGIHILGPQCRRCALPITHTSSLLCGSCLGPQQRPQQRLDQAWAGFSYHGKLAKLILDVKFHHNLAAANELGTWLAQLDCPLNLASADALLPAPLHLSRLRQRGFNQALELCRPLAHRQRLEIRSDLLLRVRCTGEQTRRNARKRQTNMAGAFQARENLAGAHIVLFDDVMTTGATMQAMASALREAGAEKVSAIVLARAL